MNITHIRALIENLFFFKRALTEMTHIIIYLHCITKILKLLEYEYNINTLRFSNLKNSGSIRGDHDSCQTA